MQELLVPSEVKTSEARKPQRSSHDARPPVEPSKPAKSAATVSSEYRVEVIRQLDQLERYLADWDNLSNDAIEPNPFYESWMLLPAVKAFAAAEEVSFYLVWQRNPRPNQPETLVGLFPLKECRLYGSLPVRRLCVWQHDYLYYCVPLVRRTVARDVLHALFDWMSNQRPRLAMLELHHADHSGAFSQKLLDVTHERGASTFLVEEYNRALFRPGTDCESYLEQSMTNHNRQEIRRKRRRLDEQGRMEVRVLCKSDNVDEWVTQFLQMEASGWKGDNQTAMACDPASRQYFQKIAREAFARDKLMLIGLYVDDRPIAFKCNFLAGTGSYAFKIAFDEAMSKFSPGVQLEIENVRLLHSMPSVHWMDSCAKPQHFMINRIWSDRRTIQKILISTGRWIDNAVVNSACVLSSLRRTFRHTPIKQFLIEQ